MPKKLEKNPLKQSELNDLSEMPFGKYKGELMQEVPASYLLWLWDQDCNNPKVVRYIVSVFQNLVDECPDFIIKKWPQGFKGRTK